MDLRIWSGCVHERPWAGGKRKVLHKQTLACGLAAAPTVAGRVQKADLVSSAGVSAQGIADLYRLVKAPLLALCAHKGCCQAHALVLQLREVVLKRVRQAIPAAAALLLAGRMSEPSGPE